MSEGDYEANAIGTLLFGDWYIYQITVTNNGMHTGYNISVDDTLPSDLEIFDVEDTDFDTSTWVIGGQTYHGERFVLGE